jgi:hypothetical protein
MCTRAAVLGIIDEVDATSGAAVSLAIRRACLPVSILRCTRVCRSRCRVCRSRCRVFPLRCRVRPPHLGRTVAAADDEESRSEDALANSVPEFSHCPPTQEAHSQNLSSGLPWGRQRIGAVHSASSVQGIRHLPPSSQRASDGQSASA